MARRKVYGASRLRRKLQRMPDEIQNDVIRTVAEVSNEVRDEISRNAPRSDDVDPRDWKGRRRKHLQDAFEVRFRRKGLEARIGIQGKRNQETFFFVRFLEFGTKFITKRAFILPTWRSKVPAARRRVAAATLLAIRRVTRLPLSDA